MLLIQLQLQPLAEEALHPKINYLETPASHAADMANFLRIPKNQCPAKDATKKKCTKKKTIFKQSAVVNTKQCLKLKWRVKKTLSSQKSVTPINQNHGPFNYHSTIALLSLK